MAVAQIQDLDDLLTGTALRGRDRENPGRLLSLARALVLAVVSSPFLSHSYLY